MKMKRQIEDLKNRQYDVLIIGGGILGLSIAWDAALRGLTVALIDKGDLGGATSSNSLRIIHGGLRHIQSLDFRTSRRFLREQKILMNLAPDLIKPMPVIVPLYGRSYFTKYPLKTAFMIYDLLGIGLDDNGPQKKFENKVLTRDECIEIIPVIERKNLTGGFLFTDCQIVNSERFSMLIANYANKAGANLANYAEALELLIEENRVFGARVKDNLSGDDFEIRSKFTVNASGPWINTLLSNKESPSQYSGNLRAFNLALRRDLTNGYAVGLDSKIDNPFIENLFSKKSRYLFITPWKGKSLIGTQYLSANPSPDNTEITRSEITDFLNDINTCYPSAELTYNDVEFVYAGYVPTYSLYNGQKRIGINKCIYDHGNQEGISGILSARGSKYTEARIVAEECVDMLLKKLGRPYISSHTGSVKQSSDAAFHNKNDIDENKVDNIVEYQVQNAIENEMAFKLSDVVFRRFDLSFEDIKNNLKQYSGIMAKELNWDNNRVKNEEDDVLSRFPNLQ